MIPHAAELARWQKLCATAEAMSDDDVRARHAELAREAAGIPASVRLAPPRWAERLAERGAEPRLQLCVALSLKWSKLPRLWRALDAVGELQTIETLYLAGPLDPKAASELATRVDRLKVERLVIDSPKLGAGIAALFGIARLHALGARDCGLHGALEHVATEVESRLAELDLSTNFLDDADVEQLVRIRGLERIERLGLTHNKIMELGATVLAERAPCELRALNLEGCQIADRGLAALAGSSRFTKLEQLNARACHVDDDGVIALAASSSFPALRELQLGENGITAVGARALLTSSRFPALTSLELRSNPIGDDVVDAVKRAGGRLSLSLDDLYLGDEARDALEGIPALELVRTR